ncbi:hypothetical protein [Salinicola sp. RZ23]|uniref:hypothetical protein n=1 Tax=Salinicola sp. RZ23 TaxID=1949087 RepID=UPI000DA16F5C|nr:hypothetical protein [Salinicola sp. RZ23]
MRWILKSALIALLFAAGIVLVASPQAFDQRLVSLEAQRALPDQAEMLAQESPALNAVFLAMADDPTLWMSARLAILHYGDAARDVLVDYGLDPAFQQVLARYGADSVLPVIYYREHDIATLRLQHWLGERYRQVSHRLTQWWGEEGAGDDTQVDTSRQNSARVEAQGTIQEDTQNDTQDDTQNDTRDSTPSDEPAELTPLMRGRLAIAALAVEGHDLLREFVIGPNGEVTRVQSERLVSDIGDLFTSGVRGLERQWRRGESIDAVDVGWAGVDLLVMASAVKVLRAGRALRAGAAVEGQGARAASRGVLAGGRFATLSRGAKVAAVAGSAYLVVRHPSLISAAGASAARWLGWPVWLGQFGVWLLVLWPLLIVVRFVYRWVLAPLLWLLVPLLKMTSRTPRWLARTGSSRHAGNDAASDITVFDTTVSNTTAR